MDKTSELKPILGQFLDWNKARLDCFTQMLLALFAVRTVNLREIAVGIEGKAKIDSRYKRLKRFFSGFTINSDIVARWIFKLFIFEEKKIYLTIDRTNWKWGKSKINILTLGVAYEGLAVPLIWQLLDKGGNASAKEHIEIISRFVSLFGKSCILGLLGDREFASGKLFGWCNEHKIPFYIRIKEDTMISMGRKKIFSAGHVFREVNPNHCTPFGMTVYIFNQKVYLSGSRSQGGKLLIVATNDNPKQAIPLYLRRWEIENLFQSLKSRGFRFEETHMTHLDRIEKLMSLLAIAFCWAHKVGEWRAIKKPIVLNKHFNSTRPQYSYFRCGFDVIRDTVLHFSSKAKELKTYIKWLVLPPANVHFSSGAAI